MKLVEMNQVWLLIEKKLKGITLQLKMCPEVISLYFLFTVMTLIEMTFPSEII